MLSQTQASTTQTNTTSTSSTLLSAGSGITGGYNGHSLTLTILIVLFPALSMYNALELLTLIFFTFNKYSGLYFWSLLVASLGVIPYSLGFLFKFEIITQGDARWLGVVLLTIGWWTMVTGQSVVLWSRLHLLLEGGKGRRTLQWTKWMIIIDAIILHLPTTVLTFGSNGSIDTVNFAYAYSIMEKIQMSGFFLQEVILSCIYIAATSRILKTSLRDNTKRLMWELLVINIMIILMDMGLLGLEAASLYLLETLLKGVIYSIKLKLEFAILGKLVQFVGRSGSRTANDERSRKASITYWGTEIEDKTSQGTSVRSRPSAAGRGVTSDFEELSRNRTNVTYNTQTSTPGNNSTHTSSDKLLGERRGTRSESIRLPPGMTLADVDVAMFQHTNSGLHGFATEVEDVAPSALHPNDPGKRLISGDAAV